MDSSEQNNLAKAIMQVIANESVAFWNKDYEAWARCWVHADYIRRTGWWARERKFGGKM